MARTAIFRMSYEAFYAILLGLDGESRYRLAGLPSGCKLAKVCVEGLEGTVLFRVEGDALPDVPEGEALPRLDLQVESADREETERELVALCRSLTTEAEVLRQQQKHNALAIHDLQEENGAFDLGREQGHREAARVARNAGQCFSTDRGDWLTPGAFRAKYGQHPSNLAEAIEGLARFVRPALPPDALRAEISQRDDVLAKQRDTIKWLEQRLREALSGDENEGDPAHAAEAEQPVEHYASAVGSADTRRAREVSRVATVHFRANLHASICGDSGGVWADNLDLVTCQACIEALAEQARLDLLNASGRAMVDRVAREYEAPPAPVLHTRTTNGDTACGRDLMTLSCALLSEDVTCPECLRALGRPHER